MRRRKEGEKFVLDTGVLVEYIVERAPYRPIVKKLLDEASSGRVRLYATPITLSETLYVASRIYEKAELSNPNEEALNYVSWIKGRVKVTKIDEHVAIKSGELKKELRLALPDCYVLATAESMNAVPLFRKPEKEMERVFDRLRKMKTKFLGEVF
ncbi:PIN domain-containing protein [Candidatus Bathyarchaeota archaeon]|nr:PIN domain-containing protein [Candidatus Bathyarchaeota archaeon]